MYGQDEHYFRSESSDLGKWMPISWNSTWCDGSSNVLSNFMDHNDTRWLFLNGDINFSKFSYLKHHFVQKTLLIFMVYSLNWNFNELLRIEVRDQQTNMIAQMRLGISVPPTHIEPTKVSCIPEETLTPANLLIDTSKATNRAMKGIVVCHLQRSDHWVLQKRTRSLC